MNIPFSPPDISPLEISEVVDTLGSGWITTGPRTKKFEEEIAKYIGVDSCVCLNSATAAMEMTLRILGVGPGDQVITTAYTYTATASVIHHVGAEIVLVDTGENSFELDYDQLEQVITEKTKVIMPVDLAGKLCDYDKLKSIVESKKSLFQPKNKIQEQLGRIIILADSAHGFGARYKGQVSGALADFTAFSFHAVKNLTTGEGGAIVWNRDLDIDSKELYKEYMLYSLHGQSKDALAKTKLGAWEYDIVFPAYKCNMTDIQAAIGLKQLSRYGDLLQRRREIIDRYDQMAKELCLQSLNHFQGGNVSSGHLYLLSLSDKTEAYRNKLILELAERGIATNVHYKPLPMLTAYKNLGFEIADFPNATKQYQREISLPLHTKLTDEEVEYVCKTIGALVTGDVK